MFQKRGLLCHDKDLDSIKDEVDYWLFILNLILINGKNLGIQEKISSFFGGLTGSVEIDIKFDQKENQKFHKIRNGKEKIKLPVYNKNDDMSGTATVTLKDCKKFEHLGIKCFLVGYLCT